MLLYKFVDDSFEDNGILMDFDSCSPTLPKPTEHFFLIIGGSDYTLPFRTKGFPILLNDISGEDAINKLNIHG